MRSLTTTSARGLSTTSDIHLTSSLSLTTISDMHPTSSRSLTTTSDVHLTSSCSLTAISDIHLTSPSSLKARLHTLLISARGPQRPIGARRFSLALPLSICLFLFGSTLSTFAQDLDFPDFRSKKDNFSKIPEKDIRADVASFSMAGVDESIGKAQLQTIPVKDYGQNIMRYENDNIQVIIKTSFFMPTKHKLMFSEKHLVKIDGKPYYGGIYGEQPHTIIESVTVLVGKDTVPIPATAYFDLYDPKFSFNQNGGTRTRNGVYLSNDKHTFYIYMLNIDNGGAEYTWVIRDKQYLRRIVDIGFLAQ